jgi:hypothetical protein
MKDFVEIYYIKMGSGNVGISVSELSSIAKPIRINPNLISEISIRLGEQFPSKHHYFTITMSNGNIYFCPYSQYTFVINCISKRY